MPEQDAGGPRHPLVPNDERIAHRDLAQWPTRAGREFVALVARLVVVLGRAWRWSLANLALVLTVLVGGGVVLGATLLASEVYDAVVVVTVLAVRRRSWLPVVLMGIAAAGSVLVTVLGKDLTGRARPPVALAVPPLESSPSFPSGHTLNATVVLGVVAYLVVLGRSHLLSRVLVGSLVVVFVLGMGLSRVWLGHHWLTDVLAGWLVGLAWLGVVVTGHRVKVTLGRTEQRPDE